MLCPKTIPLYLYQYFQYKAWGRSASHLMDGPSLHFELWGQRKGWICYCACPERRSRMGTGYPSGSVSHTKELPSFPSCTPSSESWTVLLLKLSGEHVRKGVLLSLCRSRRRNPKFDGTSLNSFLGMQGKFVPFSVTRGQSILHLCKSKRNSDSQCGWRCTERHFVHKYGIWCSLNPRAKCYSEDLDQIQWQRELPNNHPHDC